MSKYADYQPLQTRQFRLLRFKKHINPNWNDDVEFSLSIFSMDQCPIYEAISYTWGKSKDIAKVICNGHDFALSPSVESLLRHLRQTYPQAWLWIDLICINQDDLDEKSAQVKMMPDIYRSARGVTIYLGALGKDGKLEKRDEIALSLMRNVFRSYPDPRIFDMNQGSHSHKHVDTFKLDTSITEVGLPEAGLPDWLHLGHFYTKGWFSRIWIVQELCVAQDFCMLLGSVTLNAQIVLGTATKLLFYPALVSAGWDFSEVVNKAVLNASNLFQLRERYEHQRKLPLLPLIITTRNFESTLAVDKTFAVIGLARENPVDLIDYQRSPAENMVSLARWYIHYYDNSPEGSLSLLSHCSLHISDRELPSWVPGWHLDRRDYVGLVVGLDTSHPLLQRASWRLDNNQILHVDSIIFDSVSALVIRAPSVPRQEGLDDASESRFRNFAEELNRLEDLFVDSKKNHVMNTVCLSRTISFDTREIASRKVRQRYEAFKEYYILSDNMRRWITTPLHRAIPWHTDRTTYTVSGYINGAVLLFTILIGYLTRLYPRNWWQWVLVIAVYCLFDWCGGRLLSHSNSVGDDTLARARLKMLSEDSASFLLYSAHLWRGRMLCLTLRGRLVWVNQAVKVGDDICVLKGCRVPYAVRRISDNHYTLVGDVYIHDCMDGEIHQALNDQFQPIQLI